MGENRQENLSVQANQKFARQLKEIISQYLVGDLTEDNLQTLIDYYSVTENSQEVSADKKFAWQLDEITRLYLAGDLTDDHLQELIEHRNFFDTTEYPDLGFAEKVLGANKVISSNEAAIAWKLGPEGKIWPVEVLENLVKIRYSKATLRKAAKGNKNGKADWRLIYIGGLSLREQYRRKSHSFRHYVTWWLESKHDEWGKFKPIAGYYLINFRGQFGKMKYEDQEQEVSKLGSKYKSCQEAVFTEAILTISLINKEKIAEKWSHRGGLIGDGEQVIVGFDGDAGIGIHSVNISNAEPDMRIVVEHEWDF